MSSLRRAWPDEQPGLLPLLPLIYVAWADLELADDEIAGIRRVAGCADVDDPLCRALDGWLDPTRPPTAGELVQLRDWIDAAMPPDATRATSLADLGARLKHPDVPSAPLPPAAGAIEDQLGLPGVDAARSLVSRSIAPRPGLVHPPAFDLIAMQRVLDGPHADVRDRVRGWLSDGSFDPSALLGTPRSAQRQQVNDWLARLADRGLGALCYPGITTDQADMGAFFAAFETLATFDLALWTKVGVHFGLFGGSVFFLGNDAQRAEVLPRVAALELPGCFAMSETAHGSNVRDLRTTATFEPESDTFVVHTPTRRDRKDYIGNAAADARMATVFAQLRVGDEDHGVHALLVPIRTEDGQPMPGVTIEDCGEKLGLNGVDNGRLQFDQVRVPRAALLGRYAAVAADGTYQSPIASPGRRFFTMLGALVGGRVSVANAALSATKVALAVAIRYTSARRQFGPDGGPEQTVLDYPTMRARLLPRLAQVYALDVALEDLSATYVAQAQDAQGKGHARRHLESQAAGLKAITTWHATRTIQLCREACGGVGYLSENRFAALKADSDVFTTFEGDNTVLLQLVAKGLLSGFKDHFSDDRGWSVFRYAEQRAQAAIDRINPISSRRTDTEHLRSPGFQQATLDHREDDLLVSLANRLKRKVAAGADAFTAFNECQLHAQRLATAAVEAAVLRALQARVLATSDPKVADMLARLRDLYALDRIREDVGWFLERSYFEGTKAKAIRRELEALTAELAPQAVHLVDAFAIPEACIGAPIAG